MGLTSTVEESNYDMDAKEMNDATASRLPVAPEVGSGDPSVEGSEAWKKAQREMITHREGLQCGRLVAVFGLLVLLVLISLVRGGKAGSASVVGINCCR